ncbi:hypothetical protein ZIOFF_035703 [Zingiber officinale]|uniref:dUTP diphosphatase n=1 Tax=Zingiber officinale TaxID=94328 RepID=A0A8J5GA06_ZINOF|nr:hypothetical protein ZIOFF_035703 [Zingiber officinale]
MEHLPVEIIGDILSHLGTARDVVGLSATCRKWREAYKKYLHTLSFKFGDWPRDITARQLEILITQTISQTVGLQCLSIHMGSAHEFAAVPVIAWLMYTRKTLQSLSYNGHTIPNVNVPEQCSRHKLQALDLDHHSIIRVEPTYLRFTCLKSLSLRHVIISALDLSILFTVCPRIESLTLDVVEIVTSDSQSSMELSSPTLKCPNLKKLVIHGVLSGMETDEQSQMVTNVTSSVLHLMRKYIHVDVRFVYKNIILKTPKGTYARIAPISSYAMRGMIIGGGVVDSDYRGEIKILVYNYSDDDMDFAEGERIAQLILECCKTPPTIQVHDLDKTKRQDRGFGSTSGQCKNDKENPLCEGCPNCDDSTSSAAPYDYYVAPHPSYIDDLNILSTNHEEPQHSKKKETMKFGAKLDKHSLGKKY